MTCHAPGIRSYLLHLSHCGIKQQRNPRPSKWPSKRPWNLAILPPWPGKTRCRRRKNGRGHCSTTEGSPSPGSPPPLLEGDNTSDVSMVNDSLLQWDSDMVIEEEREESMETDILHDSSASTPLKEKSMLEDFQAGDPNDRCSHTSEKSTDQNPPHNSDPDEDELLGPITDISVPRGHSNDSIALIISPGEDDL